MMEGSSPPASTRFPPSGPQCVQAIWYDTIFHVRRVVVVYDEPIEDPALRDHGDAYRIVLQGHLWVVVSLELAGDSAIMMEVESDGEPPSPESDHVEYSAVPQVVVSIATGLPAPPHVTPLEYLPP